jgi:hypothetical protein
MREFVAAVLALILPSFMLAIVAAILVWEHDLSCSGIDGPGGIGI